MMDEFRRQLDQHANLLDDHGKRIGRLEIEESRTRERLHRLEGDRQALRVLVDTTRALADQTRILAEKVTAGIEQAEGLAESAAEKAVEKVLGRRSDNRWRMFTRLASALAAIGGFGYLIAYLIIR